MAASDADLRSKIEADFICDGTADDVEIQAAIDQLPALGGKVVLSEGTFTIATVIDLDSNHTLEGQGNSTILTIPNSSNNDVLHNLGWSSTTSSATGNDNVTILNLKIDGNGANQTTGGIGIYFNAKNADRSFNLVIRGVYVIDTFSQGIHLKGCDGLQMTDVTAEACGTDTGNPVHNIYLRRCINSSIQVYVYKSVTGKGLKVTICEYCKIDVIAIDNDDEGVYLGGSRFCNVIALCQGNGLSSTDLAGLRLTSEVSTTLYPC